MTDRSEAHGHREDGFTLAEVMVAVAVAGVLMAVAVSGWSSWAASRQHSGTAQQIASQLRQAQQQAVTEGRATCVLFDVVRGEWSVLRGSCDSASRELAQGPMRTASPRVAIETAAFTGPSSTLPGVTFSARGTAWPGTVRVTRSGSDKTWVIQVEGLTGRVSLS